MVKLSLVQSTIDDCHSLASTIAAPILTQINGLTTVSIERALLRLLGISGHVDSVPLANLAMANIDPSIGTLYTVASLLTSTGKGLPDVLSDLVNNKPTTLFPPNPLSLVFLKNLVLNAINSTKPIPDKYPLIYLIVATGDIIEDAEQAYAAACSGADCIAVIRSTAQSLLDYVPEGLTREGYGGTYATQQNFEYVRRRLNDAEKVTGKRKFLVNYASGLCMPEIAACASLAGVDMLLNDSLYGILFRDINPLRTLVDQLFSRKICSASRIIINTGEDNYLTTSDAVDKAHTVTASHFINYAFAKAASMDDALIGLGHAYEIDPSLPNSISYEIAHALLTRNLFPNCPVKYMPPTKHKNGDIFFCHAYDTLYNLTSILTGQSIHLVGMLTEAIHTPFLYDRLNSMRSTQYAFGAAQGLASNFSLVTDCFIQQRAATVLDEAHTLLKSIADVGLFEALGEGYFADIKRPLTGGRGAEGVFQKSIHYIGVL